jgi:hypothetical protein
MTSPRLPTTGIAARLVRAITVISCLVSLSIARPFLLNLPTPHVRSRLRGEGRRAVLFPEGHDARSAEDNLRQRGVLRCPSTRQANCWRHSGAAPRERPPLSRSCLIGAGGTADRYRPSELPPPPAIGWPPVPLGGNAVIRPIVIISGVAVGTVIGALVYLVV